MPRSRINGNFIDKTFTIIADILLRVIPTTSGEKEAFTYYRDGAIWLSLFFFYFSPIWNRKKNEYWKKNLRFWRWSLEYKKSNPFCHVSTINAALDASIMNSSIEQKVFTYGSRIRDQSYYTNTIYE